MTTSPATPATTRIIQIAVRHPDWITCRAWRAGIGSCGALNPLGENFPTRCVRCGRSW